MMRKRGLKERMFREREFCTLVLLHVCGVYLIGGKKFMAVRIEEKRDGLILD